jgi:cytochrome c biogenesis protein CcmG/thiol:disulfide interchange protein DsbE
MTRRHRQLRASVLAVAVALLVGCTAQTPGNPTGSVGQETPTPRDASVSPIGVEGVADCATLPTTPAQDAAERLPDIQLPCLTSKHDVNVSELRGHPVVVNLWATWCGPCRKEMPVLQEASERYGADVTFLGVDTRDEPVAAASFIEEVGVTYPQLVDLDGQLLAYTRVPGLPVTLVLDPSGTVAARHVGPLDEDRLDALLQRFE